MRIQTRDSKSWIRSSDQQVGEFVIDQKIGGGNTTTVYRAFQPTINRHVALKMLDSPFRANERPCRSLRASFYSGSTGACIARTSAYCADLSLWDRGRWQCAYIAMRLMRESLETLLAEGAIQSQRVVGYYLQLIEGLSYAHKKGVLHQDIKPENILFDEAGSACLADFGLTHVNRPINSRYCTQPTSLQIPACYISPEQIRGTNPDTRSDIYSLGVVMYQMLTGHLPFEAENLSIDALLHKIDFEAPIPPRKTESRRSRQRSNEIVLQALRKEPRERFFDVREMAQALEAVPGTRSTRSRPALICSTACSKAVHFRISGRPCVLSAWSCS